MERAIHKQSGGVKNGRPFFGSHLHVPGMPKDDRFAKTGSGQTLRKVEGKVAFLLVSGGSRS
jgi:hypothetical protein